MPCRSPDTWQIVGPLHCETVLTALQNSHLEVIPSSAIRFWRAKSEDGRMNSHSLLPNKAMGSTLKPQNEPLPQGSWGTKLRDLHAITQSFSRSARHVPQTALTACFKIPPSHYTSSIHRLLQSSNKLCILKMNWLCQMYCLSERNLNVVKLSRASRIQIIVPSYYNS